MREKLRALYYPDSGVEMPTLKKAILLFDEIHFMDRPAFTLLAPRTDDNPSRDGTVGMLGMASPLRQYEKSFREDAGIPLYVHNAPGGPLYGDLLESIRSDVADPEYANRFQEGLRKSRRFRDLNISPGNYGSGETHDSIFSRVEALDLGGGRPLIEILDDSTLRLFEYSTEDGCRKFLAVQMAFNAAKMNFAFSLGMTKGFSPFADLAPYGQLLGAKYLRAIAPAELKVKATDLSLAILDELVPPDRLQNMALGDVIRYRKESEPAREAFLEHLTSLGARIGALSADGDFAAAIEKLLMTEVRPAARQFRNKLDSIYESMVGKIAGGALLWVGSSAAIQILTNMTWERIALGTIAASAYAAAQAVGALVETRSASRECAISYLLDLEK